jgi:hypothetical protein
MAAKSLIFALMAFVQANSPLDAPESAPFVKFVSAKQLHYMAQPDVPYDGKPIFLGLHRNGFIFLAEPWSASDVGDRARLLHEVVHYMQARSNRTYLCRGKREAQAYDLQRIYLESEGADPSDHMPNGVRLSLAVMCHPAGEAARSR